MKMLRKANQSLEEIESLAEFKTFEKMQVKYQEFCINMITIAQHLHHRYGFAVNCNNINVSISQ